MPLFGVQRLLCRFSYREITLILSEMRKMQYEKDLTGRPGAGIILKGKCTQTLLLNVHNTFFKI